MGGLQQEKERRNTKLWEPLCPALPLLCLLGRIPGQHITLGDAQPQLWHTASACRGGEPDVPDVPVCCLCLSPGSLPPLPGIHHPPKAPIIHPWHSPSIPAPPPSIPALASSIPIPTIHLCSYTQSLLLHHPSLFPPSIPVPTLHPFPSTLHPLSHPPSLLPALTPAPVKLLELQDLLPGWRACKGPFQLGIHVGGRFAAPSWRGGRALGPAEVSNQVLPLS